MLNWLFKIGRVIRITALSLLFAGSAAIVFAAVTLVKAGEAKGIPVSQAAAANAPVFIHYSKVVAIACLALIIVEVVGAALHRNFSRIKIAQYIASTLCCVCGLIYALHTAPLMEHLLGYINYDPAIHQSFQELHKLSRVLFSGMILFAWLSLILPIFACTHGKVSQNTDICKT